MNKQIDALVAAHDAESLYELMIAGDDDFLQLDAAEGLVRMADGRGLRYLDEAEASDDKDIREYAREILRADEMPRLREQIEAAEESRYQARVETARKRLKNGKRVYRYKVIFIPAIDILQEDYAGEGIALPDLDDAGLDGWEVVNIIPRRQLLFDINDHVSGTYAFLKKQVDDGAELDES